MGTVLTLLIIVAGIWLVIVVVKKRDTATETEESPKRTAADRIESDSLSVGDDYFADIGRSPDKRYIAAARSPFHVEGKSTKGLCVLVEADSGEVLFRVSINNPNNPNVSNQGLVTVEDWKGDKDNLSGALIALNSSGERIWAKYFKANIYTSGLSEDGVSVFVSTCNSSYEPHSGKTFLIDLKTGKTIWKSDVWRNVRFCGNTLVIELQMPDGTTKPFAFDERGQLGSDYDETVEAIARERERGAYWAVLPKVQKVLKDNPPDTASAKELLSELEGKEETIPESSQAIISRYHGEIEEAEGNIADALAFYRKALDLDPKVGILRRYNALMKNQES
jgi:tetratricopeptide (TPR) repeat protein